MNPDKSTPAGKTAQGKTADVAVCYHCGESCKSNVFRFDEKAFCCEGCKLVYEILRDKDLCTYYTLDKAPGISPEKNGHPGQFDFLDDEIARQKLIRFNDHAEAHVTFFIPGMHCSSCIWLLENLHKLEPAVFSATVDFPRKEVNIVYHSQKLKLSSLAALLSRIGYPPSVSLSDMERKHDRKQRRGRLLKQGLAGFCFGNIMMLSFPEYFAPDGLGEKKLGTFFSALNLALSLPVFFYCASEFFISAWKGIRQRFLNIDAPIALAILVTFARSVYEILSGTGAGYLDSMSGIVFFMLVGRFFQDRTYDTLSFDRDYKSYFPLGTTIIDKDGNESRKLVSKLEKGERIRVRNQELVPADALLMSYTTHIDYSFITGESAPVHKVAGELIYAGARQLDGAVDLEVVQPTSQSYLTQLWNREQPKDKLQPHGRKKLVDVANKYFTIVVLTLALSASVYWSFQSMSTAINVFTAVLIVACPCGLLLTSVFANGNIMRIMGRNGLYLKNSDVIEKLGEIDAVVFDKTGTITLGSEVEFVGDKLDIHELCYVASLVSQSSHPLSRRLDEEYKDIARYNVFDFREYTGQGISGTVKGSRVKLGSQTFINSGSRVIAKGSRVYLSIDGVPMGYFCFGNHYRQGLGELVEALDDKYLSVLSGDNDSEYAKLREIFGEYANLLFGRKPGEKEEYITALQYSGKKVMMLGDGLNDAGALRQSDVGIAITDDTNAFSPACSAILDGKSLPKLRKLMDLAKVSQSIILFTFLVSLVYNIAGLSFAVRGDLSPLVAAVLMPLSSISIVLLATTYTNLAAKLRKL